MTQASPKTRTFSVHARHMDGHHARTLEETSFEAAAIAYVEDLHGLEAAGSEINIIVRDVGGGHEHCFRIDLESGEASPCG